MSALVIALAMVAIFATAATTALVLSRASREEEIRREIAADIRDRVRQVQRFSPDGQFTHGLLTAAAIVEHKPLRSGFVTVDAAGRPRVAGDYRRSS